jgi:hypothetical protein
LFFYGNIFSGYNLLSNRIFFVIKSPEDPQLSRIVKFFLLLLYSSILLLRRILIPHNTVRGPLILQSRHHVLTDHAMPIFMFVILCRFK